MKQYSVDEINRQITNAPSLTVKEAEEEYEQSLQAVARSICRDSKDRPVVLIAGTSGSSKTTTALRLAENIEKMGHHAHALSMDDYFLNKAECALLFPEGEIDYESPMCVDKTLLNEHMQKMAAHEPIEVPQFDFLHQCRKSEGQLLECQEGDIVIIEGIHGLNPLICGELDDVAVKIYVELQACVGDCAIELCSPKLRMLRRIMRDSRFRGHSVERTVDYFNKLSVGEEKFILPFVDEADYRINTFLNYELNVYRNDLLELFAPLDETFCAMHELDKIKTLLQELQFLPLEYAPTNSLVREFTGESSLQY